MSKRTRQPTDIARNVVQDPDPHEKQAASRNCCTTIGELYLGRLEALSEIGTRLASEYNPELSDPDEPSEDAPENQQAVSRFERAVDEWAAQNQVRCAAVIDAAEEFARVAAPQACACPQISIATGEAELILRDSGITAFPHNETRDEFLKKAGQYYDALVRRWVGRGAKRGPIKREHDHFMYLAAHLVGGSLGRTLRTAIAASRVPRPRKRRWQVRPERRLS